MWSSRSLTTECHSVRSAEDNFREVSAEQVPREVAVSDVVALLDRHHDHLDIIKPMDKQKIVGIGERESWDIRTNQISTYDVEERNLSLESSQSERHFIVQSGSEYPRMSQSIDSCIQDSLLNRLIPGTRREQPAILC